MKKFSLLVVIIVIVSCGSQTRQSSTFSKDVSFKLDKVVKIGLISILYYHLHNEFSNSIDSLLNFKSYQKIFSEQSRKPDSTLGSLISFSETQIDSFRVSTNHENKAILSFLIKGTNIDLMINLNDLKTELNPVNEDSIQQWNFNIDKINGELRIIDDNTIAHFKFSGDSIRFRNPTELEEVTGEVRINNGEYKLTK